MRKKTIEIIIVDDNAFWRNSMSAYLREIIPEAEIVGTAEDGNTLLDLLKKIKTDLVFLDLSMPRGLDGMDTLKAVRQKYPKMKVIICSSYDSTVNVDACLAAGAAAFLSKGSDPDTIIRTVTEVIEKGQSVDLTKHCAEKTQKELNDFLMQKYGLIEKEIRVLRMLCNGASTRLISSELQAATRTIERRIQSIYKKTGSVTVADIVNFAHKNGIN